MNKDKFICPCGCGIEADRNIKFFLESLEREMQKHIDKYELHINSVIRCADYNEKKGGSPTSEHLFSMAADIAVQNATERYWLIKSMLCNMNIKRILIYPTFIHMGISNDHPAPVISYMR